MPKAKNVAPTKSPTKSTLSAAARAAIARTAASRKALYAGRHEFGGTWRTVGMARDIGRPLALVLPSGQVVKERWLF